MSNAMSEQKVYDPMKVDPILGLYIELVEARDDALPVLDVTLALSGMLVSGQIITIEEYFRQTGLRSLFDLVEGEKTVEAESNTPRNYIHLKNAKFFFGAHVAIPTGDGVLWRGRLTEVVGFHSGRLVSTAS